MRLAFAFVFLAYITVSKATNSWDLKGLESKEFCRGGTIRAVQQELNKIAAFAKDMKLTENKLDDLEKEAPTFDDVDEAMRKAVDKSGYSLTGGLKMGD